MSNINTVAGSIDSSQLGLTLTHEHFLMVDSSMRFSFPDWIDYPAVVKQSAEEVRLAMNAGVRTIIDATPINLGRDIHLLRDISARTGINIIASTGFYYQERPWFRENNFSEDRMVDILAGEAENGMQGTDSRPGIIKCATDEQGLTPMNEKLLRMAARLHKRTGLPIMTHASVCNRAGLIQQRIFYDEGVELSRVIIGHCDDTNDIGYISEIIKNGSYAGLDRMGVDRINPLDNRITVAEQLIKAGYGKKIVLSHDCNVMSDCGRVGGERGIRRGERDWNFRIIPEKVLPELKKRGISDDDIDDTVRGNIRRFFEQRYA